MTREEFTERVGLNVSDGIFEVWNGVYMSSDKDKDEFCKPFATKKWASRSFPVNGDRNRRIEEKDQSAKREL